MNFLVHPPVDMLRNTVDAAALRTERLVAWLLCVIAPLFIIGGIATGSGFFYGVLTLLSVITVIVVSSDAAAVAVAIWAVINWERTLMRSLAEVLRGVGVPPSAIQDVIRASLAEIERLRAQEGLGFKDAFMGGIKVGLSSVEVAARATEVLANASAEIVDKVQDAIDKAVMETRKQGEEKIAHWGTKLLHVVRWIAIYGMIATFFAQELKEHPAAAIAFVIAGIGLLLVTPFSYERVKVTDLPKFGWVIPFLMLVAVIVLLAFFFGWMPFSVGAALAAKIVLCCVLMLAVPVALYIGGWYGFVPILMLAGALFVLAAPNHARNLGFDLNRGTEAEYREFKTKEILIVYDKDDTSGKPVFTPMVNTSVTPSDTLKIPQNVSVRMTRNGVVPDEVGDKFIEVLLLDGNGRVVRPIIKGWIYFNGVEIVTQSNLNLGPSSTDYVVEWNDGGDWRPGILDTTMYWPGRQGVPKRTLNPTLSPLYSRLS